MEDKALFKVGDIVIYRKIQVGKILDVELDKRTYVVAFYGGGIRRVRFSTEMKLRENADYKVYKVPNLDKIHFYYDDEERFIETIPFSADEFLRIMNDRDNVVYNGKSYICYDYQIYVNPPREIVSEISREITKYDYCITVVFELVEKEYLQREREYLNEDDWFPRLVHKNPSEKVKLFKEAVLSKYGVVIDIN